jgi:uncharacterized membrane protein HdeD (DUF308 family)
VTSGTTATWTDTLHGRTAPDSARRAWPRWLLLGLGMIAVAVIALGSSAAGSRLLLGALGLFLGIRGAVLARRAGSLDAELSARAPRLGALAVVVGGAAVVVAALSAAVSGAVLLVVVPLALLSAAAALVLRGGPARRVGEVLLVWSALVAVLLALIGLAQSWTRAADLAVVVGALAVAVLAVPVLVAAWQLRSAAGRPEPARPAACGGCACGAGGCGALG